MNPIGLIEIDLSDSGHGSMLYSILYLTGYKVYQLIILKTLLTKSTSKKVQELKQPLSTNKDLNAGMAILKKFIEKFSKYN